MKNTYKIKNTWGAFLIGLLVFCCNAEKEQQKNDFPRKIELLFLGHDSEHHNSAAYMPLLASSLTKEGINFTYTNHLKDLNPQTLAKYDGLVIYANHEQISPSQEEALLEFVKNGKGLIPVHCASFCFLNSKEYVELVGARFQKHETGTFQAKIINKSHPVMKDVQEFTTWDETYVHEKLSTDRTVLMERIDGEHHEPWTWVKEYGKGRVFYTAYGHDDRTWSNPGFHQLMKRGILWAVGDKVQEQWQAYRKEIPDLTYKSVPNIPNYEKRHPAPQYQEPLSPEESKKLIQVPVDFELQLFASEPDIINPVAMEWDEKGRLWVIETVDYPNTVRDNKGEGDDRIKIFEDTDGDGKSDKFTVFAEGLNIPTSLTFANGGIIVSQAPHFLFLKDTDGDDKADVRQVLMDGWGTFDTHAGPSNLKYAMDNHIWGVVGYSGYKGNIGGKPIEFGQGVYRFTPDFADFEFITKTSNNTWGFGITEANDIFASTANNTHSVFMGIPDRYFSGVEGIPVVGSAKIDGHYAMHPITDKVRQVDVFGGFTAASGHHLYTARNYPKNYWNQIALVCEPTGHLVHMGRIKKEGAGFVEKDEWNLFASTDEWVSPVEAKVGPDGAVWVLDWYNFIVQHNPTPTPDRGGYKAENGEGNAYINPLRDSVHGRIWRIVYKGAKPYDPISLDKDNPSQLVKALENDNMFWRMTAQRLLVERGELDVLSELYVLVKNRTVDELDLNPAALHALWTIHGLGALDKNNKEAYQVAVDALQHPAPSVRKAAIQVLPKTLQSYQAFQRANVLNDPDPNTRLSAVLAMSEMEPSEQMGKLLYKLTQEKEIENDPWLSKAVYLASAKHRDGFIAAYLKEHPDFMEKNKPAQTSNIARENPALNDSKWKNMKLPTFIEQAGLEIDGIIWFRKTFEVPGNAAGKKAVLSLGPIDDTDDTWVNGVKVGGIEKSWNIDRVYNIPEGLLKAGKNTVSIKVEDTGGGGGFGGKADNMFVRFANNKKVSLAGNWKYEVAEERNNQDINAFKQVSIADFFMKNYWDHPQADKSPVGGDPAEEVQVIRIGVIKNEMKFDKQDFTVEAGKKVEIVFENIDFMQHNLVIVQQGEMETVGLAADKLAANPKGAEMQYVPNITEVLFYTPLVNPEETVKLTFTAPERPGEYPFVCTFPGHWRIMNGVMKVVKKNKTL